METEQLLGAADRTSRRRYASTYLESVCRQGVDCDTVAVGIVLPRGILIGVPCVRGCLELHGLERFPAVSCAFSACTV